MDLEEAEDEERDTMITSTSQNWSEPNTNNGSKVNYVFKKGLNVGKKILVFGFVATSVPIVLPGFVVASAIGLVVSMPCALFLVSHSCTQNLMSKLLPQPSPTHQGRGPLLLEDVCFKQDSDITDLNEEDEAKRDNVMVDVSEESVILDKDYGQRVVNEEFEPELSHSSDANNVIQLNGSEKDSTDYFSEEEEEEPSSPKLDDEKPMNGGTIVEGFDENEELKAPFEFGVTDVVIEECGDEVKEGDIEEEEMHKETKGLLEKIRDEGRNDMRGEYAKGVSSGTSESHQNIGSVIENVEAGQEDKRDLWTEGVENVEAGQEDEYEGEIRSQEDSKVCEETVQSRNYDNMDNVCNEVELGEFARGKLELEVDGSNDSQQPVTETSELIDGRSFQDEPIGNLMIETQVLNILVAEDLSEVTDDKIDTNENVEAGQEDKQDLWTEGEMRNQEDPKVCEETVQSGNDDDNKGSVCNEVESGEPSRGNIELEDDGSNDSQQPVSETSELIDGSLQDEPSGDLRIEMQVIDILVGEDSSEVTDDKIDTHEKVEEKLEPTILQKVELDDNISDLVNQEMQLHEYNKIMDSSDADATEIADESELHLCDENRIDPGAYSYTIDLQEGQAVNLYMWHFHSEFHLFFGPMSELVYLLSESSSVTVEMHTDSMEVLVSSIELESRSSECSAEKNIVCPSEEVNV